MSTGRPPAEFITRHFLKLDKLGNKSGRYFWKCKYCGDINGSKGEKIEGRDNLLYWHLADIRKCSHAPSNARAEARLELMKKGKVAPVGPDDTILGNGQGSSELTPVDKKRKASQGPLDPFMDRILKDDEVANANIQLFRYN